MHDPSGSALTPSAMNRLTAFSAVRSHPARQARSAAGASRANVCEIDLGGVEGARRVIDQRLGDSLANRDDAAAIRPESL
jgi:hypothetical protein